MISRDRLIDLLAMSRFANLPTVWSNGFLGAFVGWKFLTREGVATESLNVILVGLALSCLYLGGCFFNDAHDLEFDQKTRPDRPIPAGRWKRATIFKLAIGLMVFGCLLASFASLTSGLFSLGILICILAYTKWHKKTAWSFFFMAGARALIYPTAAFNSASWQDFQNLPSHNFVTFFLLGLGLGGYILGISLTAKSESAKTPPTSAQEAVSVSCLCAPALLISAPLLLTGIGKAAIPLALFFLVLIFSVRSVRANHDVGRFVSRTLAAIPLVDFLLIVPLTNSVALWMVCPLLALTALGLQKIAPAT